MTNDHRATEAEVALTVIGLRGILWALNMLVVHRVADDVAYETDVKKGISDLITAGYKLTEEITPRL